MRFLPLLTAFAISCTPARSELFWAPLNEPGSGGWLTSLRVHPSNSQHLVLGGDMLGLGVSRDGGKSWGGGFGLPNWEIGDVTFHPSEKNTVWAGTMSGPVVSRDGGTTWELKRRGLPEVSGGFYSAPIQKILIDPENPNRLLAFAGTYRGWSSPGSPKFGFVWESLDGGETWADFASIRPYRNITWVDADRDWKRLFAVVENRGVYTSEDRGRTWKEASTGLPKDAGIRMVAVHPTDANVAWTATGNRPGAEKGAKRIPGGVFKTVDGGASWEQIGGDTLPSRSTTNQNFTTRFQAIAVSPVDPNQLLTSDTSWDHNAVYHSADGGATWTKVLGAGAHKTVPFAYPAGMGATVISFDPSEAGTSYLGNSETVLKSTDRGATWADITSSPVRGESRTTWRGHGYSGLCSTRVGFNPFVAGSVVLTAMDAAKHVRSDDGLASWFFYDRGFSQPWGGGNDVAFAKPDGRIAYVAAGQHGSQGAIARTDDGGLTWAEFQGPAFGLPETAKAEAVAVHCDPDQPDLAWAIMGRKLFATTNGGKSWQVIDAVPSPTTIGKASDTAYPFYVGGADGIYRTSDGKTFARLEGSPAAPVRIHVPASAPENPLAVRHRVAEGGVFRLANGKWDRLFKDSHAFDVATSPANPSRLAVATHDDPYHDISRATGVWISEDGGSNWKQANSGLSCLRGKAIAFDPHDPTKLVFGSFGRGFFQASWPEKTAE